YNVNYNTGSGSGSLGYGNHDYVTQPGQGPNPKFVAQVLQNIATTASNGNTNVQLNCNTIQNATYPNGQTGPIAMAAQPYNGPFTTLFPLAEPSQVAAGQ